MFQITYTFIHLEHFLRSTNYVCELCCDVSYDRFNIGKINLFLIAINDPCEFNQKFSFVVLKYFLVCKLYMFLMVLFGKPLKDAH